jgi:hypothetical protein
MLLSIWISNFGYSIPQYYIDAGTGSLIIQILFGSTVGVLVVLKMTWRNIKKWFKHKPVSKEESSEVRDRLIE